MNRFTLTVLFGFISILLFIIDKSLTGIFDFSNYFSLSITFLMILVNLQRSQPFTSIFFLFGLLSDWFNKSFVGLYSLISVVLSYIYLLLKLKIAGNKIALFITNFVTSYALYLISLHFDYFFNIKAFIGALLTTLISSLLWFRSN
jgi:hypothetical protein